MRTIKLNGTLKYEIALMQTEAGQYVVKYETDSIDAQSGPYDDYKTADFVYEEILQDLQGN
jgi:hypothetical protein